MAREIDSIEFQLSSNSIKVLSESSREAVSSVLEVRSKSSKELAADYGVSDKTIQSWFKAVCAAYCWLEPETLKTGRSAKTRYTPLCQALIAEYRASASDLAEEEWIASVHAAHPEKLATVRTAQQQAEVPISPTEVLPHQGYRPHQGDNLGGLTLHPGSSLAMPAISSLVPPSDDTAYLTRIETRLAAFESLQQQAISQMQEQFEQAQALNTQYQEAMSLSDQLLLKEFQLKGMQLGYTALQLKQQAFKATIQAVEAGSLPTPGKPLAERDRPPAA